MPNDNLGTAHGSIRIDLEDRASGKLLQTLVKLSRQFDEMNKRLGRIEKTLKSTDNTFEHTAKSIDRTTKATRGFASGVFAANKSVTRFSRDVRDLYDNFNRLSSVIERANSWYQPLNRAYRVLDLMQKVRFDGPTNGLLRFNKALSGAGVYNNILRRYVSNFLGIKEAVRDMPLWTQNINRFATKLAVLGSAGLAIGRISRTGIITKWVNQFANTGPIRKMILANERFAVGAERVFRTVEKIPRAFDAFNRGFQPIADFAKATRGFITGVALIKSGVDGIISKFQFLKRIPTPILKGLALTISQTLPLALSVLSKALSGTSNLLLGLADGVRQLSGGLLVLPGVFASIGAVAASLVPVFAGLKDKFKDVFSDDPIKALQAYYKLPKSLRPVADAIDSLIPKWKELQESLRGTAFAGAADQIKALGQTYFPIWEGGATKVVAALRDAKDALVGFAQAGQTQKDVSTLFTNTAGTIETLAKAIRPALDGLRDIAAVGSSFIRDLSGGLPNLINQFAQWANVNRQNGNLLKWMQDARQGVKDLISGFTSLTKAVWSLLTVFRTNTGGDFLARFADSMERFNQSVQKSAAAGTLRDIGNAVREMSDPGGNRLQDFKDTFHDFVDMMKNVYTVIKSTADAFSAEFLPALQSLMQFISAMAELKHALGLDEVLGRLLGIIAAWKIFDHIAMVGINTIKTFVGVFLTLRNAGKIISGLDTALLKVLSVLDNFGPVGKKASQSISNVRTSLSGVISTLAGLAGPIAGVLLVVGAGWLAWDERNKTVKKGLDAINDSAAHIKQAGTDIRNAFIDDRGVAGHTVMDAITQSLDTMFSDLQAKSEAMPGIISHIGDVIRTNFTNDAGKSWSQELFGFLGGESNQLNAIQKSAADAQQALNNFKSAGVTQNELRVAISGSADAYNDLVKRLYDAGAGADQAKAQVDALRDQFNQAAQSAQELGTGGIQLAAGIDKIKNAAGDATTKLDGLKLVLQALGFLKTDALEAASNYADAIQNLSQKVSEAISSGDGLNNVWDNVNNKFNENTQTGRNLIGVFGELSQNFLTFASSGGNVDEMFAQLNAQLPDVAKQLGISVDQLREFIKNYEGIVPEPIKIAVQIEGKDQLTQALGTLLISLQAIANGGVAVPITFKDATPQSQADLERQIEAAIGQDVLDLHGTNLVLKPDVKLNPTSLQNLINTLNQHGIDTTNKKADPNTLPSITPNIKPPSTDEVSKAVSPVEEALAKLDVDAKSAADAIQGSADQFAEFLKMLADKKAPQALIDTLKQMRDQFENGGSQVKKLTDAIRDFSDQTIDADQRAQNFIKSLENLGKLPNDDALAKYQDDVEQAIGYQANLVDALDKTGAALVLQNGRIDQNSKNGRELSKTIRQLVQDSAALVATGDATPEEAYQHTSDVLKELLNQFNITDPNLQQQIINTYFPADAFQQGLKDAMSSADPRKTIEDIFHQDPAKLDSVLNLLSTNEDILNKIVGPDGKLHIPSVFDPNMPGVQPHGWWSNSGLPGTGPGAGAGLPLPAPQPLPPPTAPAAPNAAEIAGKLSDDQLTQIFASHPDIAQILGPYTEKAAEQGQSFSEAFAQGIKDGDPAVKRAIEELAELAGDGLGHSPAKYGPLSGRGWTLYRGKTFSKSWAQGITSEAGSVKGAVSGVAGEAAVATGSYDPQAGGMDNFLKQLKDLSSFGQHILDAFTSIADIAINVAQLANTFSGGRLAPKQYIPDPTADRRRGNRLAPFNPQGTPSNLRMPSGQPTAAGGQIPLVQKPDGTWTSSNPEWAKLIARESGGVANRKQEITDSNTGGNEASGLFQIAKGTWASNGGTKYAPTAGEATPQQQAEIATKIFLDQGVDPWGGRENEDLLRQGLLGATSASQAPGPVRPGVLHDTGGKVSQAASINAANLIEQLFPQISNIGGARPDSMPYHPEGRALDIMIPGGSTMGGANPQGKLLGDQIKAWALANADKLGLEDTIWQDFWQPPGGQGNSLGRASQGPTAGHFDHVHLTFKPGFQPDNLPPGALTSPTETAQNTPVEVKVVDQNGNPITTVPAGTTGVTEVRDQNGNLLTSIPPTASMSPNNSLSTTNDLLTDIDGNLAPLPQALQDIGVPDPRNIKSQDEAVTALQQIDSLIADQNNNNTPQSKAIIDSLGSMRSQIMGDYGLTEGPNAIDQASSVISNIAGVAGDIFKVVNSAIEAVGATKDITDTLIRYPSNTEDIFRMIDDFQKYIQLGADIAGAVSSIANAIGSAIPSAGGADFGGTSAAKAAVQGVAQIAGIIQSALETVNAVIDLGQEAYRIIGTYVGDFLGFLVGGQDSLRGNIKFLLDTQTNELLSYSQDNPLDKRTHEGVGGSRNTDSRNQLARDIYVFGGPGQDPRDNTRQMMLQIKMNQMTAPTGQ
jgi:hypothetical protein